jgi:RNA polymerase sigma factor (sigma-70 family)
MNDLEFAQRCVKGDKQAWDEFLNRYSRLIYNYIHSVLNTKGHSFAQEDTNDIFHEIISSLIEDNFKKLKSFRGKNGCSLASWLRQVTINFAIDYIRRSKPAVSIEEEMGEESLTLKEILSDDSESLLDKLNLEERLGQLKECIGRLENDEKYFLELFMNRNLSPETLGQHLRISRPAVDMRKMRIIRRLRECFKNKGFLLDF